MFYTLFGTTENKPREGTINSIHRTLKMPYTNKVEKRDNAVDYARLALALSVCLYHTQGTYHLWPKGYDVVWAVPAFLAISGYYVLQSYEQSVSWREFIKKRVLRIAPAFAVSLAVVGSAVNVWPTLISYGSLGLIQPKGWANIPVWSLGAEEVAYALLVILFTLGAYKRVWPIWIGFAVRCRRKCCANS